MSHCSYCGQKLNMADVEHLEAKLILLESKAQAYDECVQLIEKHYNDLHSSNFFLGLGQIFGREIMRRKDENSRKQMP